MKKKELRKIKQIYSRDLRALADAKTEFIKDIFKPKPKWIPAFLWLWFIKRFVKIKIK